MIAVDIPGLLGDMMWSRASTFVCRCGLESGLVYPVVFSTGDGLACLVLRTWGQHASFLRNIGEQCLEYGNGGQCASAYGHWSGIIQDEVINLTIRENLLIKLTFQMRTYIIKKRDSRRFASQARLANTIILEETALLTMLGLFSCPKNGYFAA